MQVLPDNVVHVFGTLCSRGRLDDDEGNPKPTWGLAVAREEMARIEARVGHFFCSKSLIL